MGAVAFAALLIGASIAANLSVDVGINTLQNWYDTVYADAYWSHRAKDTPALRALALEEAQIDRLLKEDESGTTETPAP